MTEIKSYLQKLRRSSVLKKSGTGETRTNGNGKTTIQRNSSKRKSVRRGMGNGPSTTETRRQKARSILSHRASAFITQPLTNEELDAIRYSNLAVERDFRRGVRPKIPQAQTVQKFKGNVNPSLDLRRTTELTDLSETSAIVEEFSNFLENSFNGLSISVDTDISQLSAISASSKDQSKGIESIWGQEFCMRK